MKTLSMLTFTVGAVSMVVAQTPAMDELRTYYPKCDTQEDRDAHDSPYGVSITAAADDGITGAWLDGVEFPGIVGSNHGRSKGWQNLTREHLQEDKYRTSCVGEVCEHVLTVRAVDAGQVITGFIALVDVNNHIYKTGIDQAWRGRTFKYPSKPNSEFDESWKDIHFDDSDWNIAGSTPRSSEPFCLHGGWGNKFERNLGAKWIDAKDCRSDFGMGRVYRLKFQTATCPPPTASPTMSPTESPTASPTTSNAVTQDGSCDVKRETTNDKCPNILFVHEWDVESRRKLNEEVLNHVKKSVDAIVARRKTPCTTPFGVTEVSKINNLKDFDVTSDLYTQVWLMQLNWKMKNPAVGSANDLKYRSLARWFNAGYPSKHSAIILDGRIASSTTGGSQWSKKGTYSHPTDMKIVTNYVENLHKRGGGLFLGTDHGVAETSVCGEFTCGINTVTDELKISKFWGFFPPRGRGRDQKVAYVDTASPLMTTPEIAYESTASAMVPDYTCTNAAQCPLHKVYDQVVWDHTSTSQTAIGLQENGMIFYSVAFHSGSVTKPAIATNIKGGLNFQIGVDTPTCNECFVTGDSFTLTARVEVESRAPYGNWEITYTGKGANPLPEASTFQTSEDTRSITLTTLPLEAGNHSFRVTATDANGNLDAAIVKIQVDNYGCFDASPYYGKKKGPCFKWGVKWPCRGCKSPYNRDGKEYGKDKNGGGGGGGCAPSTDPVWCQKGYKQCPNGVRKCFLEQLTKPAGDECDPEPNTLCGGGNTDEGKEDEDGDKKGPPTTNDDDEEEEEEEEEKDEKGTPTTNDDDDEEEEEEEEEKDGDGEKRPTHDDEEEEEEKKRKGPFRPFPIPTPEDCEDCPEAQFKCHEAQCEDWDCLWWCRCYDDSVEYTCEDDNDPCDCSSFGDQLYNVTYGELACSSYMDVKFSGPGAAKYNKQMECCRDPEKSIEDCPLDGAVGA